MRNLGFCTHKTIQWCGRLPNTAGELGLLYMFPCEVRRGIRFLDPEPITRNDFMRDMEAALDLIAATSPHRLARVLLEIRRIDNIPTITGLYYARQLRNLSIDWKGLAESKFDEDEKTGWFACLLVLAATSGYLESRGIFPTSKNFDRREQFCRREMVRFAKKIDMEWLSFIATTKTEPIPVGDKLRWFAKEVRRIWNKKF